MMINIPITDGVLHLSDINFKCPDCNKDYSDTDDKYLNRINKNKTGFTKIKCECNNSFCLTYDYTGDFVTFKNK